VTAGGFDFQQLLQQAQQMRDQLARGQEELAELRVQGTAGGGLVKATLTGEGELVELAISSQAVDPDDTETLADLIIAAVRDARDQLERQAAQRMAPFTEGIGGLLGGLGDAGGAGGLGGAGGVGGAGGLGGEPAGPGEPPRQPEP
jgi:nucleoid-associated protein EbfC